MTALSLGLIAALAWGFHDICVRWVSQSIPLMAMLLSVLIAGLIFHTALMLTTAGFTALPPSAYAPAAASGVLFVVASIGLYGAFQRGPVRLAAPIIAAYPILSVGWAALRGTPVSGLEWLAVIAIIIGVSIVAALAGEEVEDIPPKGRTILYSVVAAIGFAGTFALGQLAVEQSDELSVTLITRLIAIALLVVSMAALRLPFWPGLRPMPVLVLMGLADGIALVCVMAAGGLPDAQYAAVAASTFGLLTIVLAWLILREPMTRLQWMGCLLAFAGIGFLAL